MKCSSFACSARWPRTRSTPSRCCWPCTWWAARWVPRPISAGRECRQPRQAARPPAVPAGGGLPARHRDPVGGRRRQAPRARGPRSRAWPPRWRPKPRWRWQPSCRPTFVMGALFSHLSVAGAPRRQQPGPALGLQHLGRGRRAVGVRRPARASARTEVRTAAGRRRLPRACVATRAPDAGVLATCSGQPWHSRRVAPPLAFIDVPEGGRIVSYRRRRDGGSQRRGRRATASPACASTTASRKAAAPPCSPMRARRCSRCCCIRRRGMPCSSAWAPGVTATSAAEDATLQVDAVELLPEVIAASAHFTEPFAKRRAKPAPARDGRRRAPLRENDARNATTSSSPTTSIRRAAAPARCTRSSISEAVREPPRRRRRVLPMAAAASTRPRHPAQHRAYLHRGVSRTAGRCWPPTASRRRCWAWSRARTASASRCIELRERLAATQRRRSAWPTSASPTNSRCWADSSRGPRALARFAGKRRCQHRRPPGRRLSSAAHHLRARFVAARQAAGAAARTELDPGELHRRRFRRRLVTTPGRVLGGARSLSRSRPRRAAPPPIAQRMLAQVREPLLAVLRISPDFRPAYDPLLRLASAAGAQRPDRSAVPFCCS